jgi:hypothetical protein
LDDQAGWTLVTPAAESGFVQWRKLILHELSMRKTVSLEKDFPLNKKFDLAAGEKLAKFRNEVNR